MTRGSVSLSCATTLTLPAFLNLNGTYLRPQLSLTSRFEVSEFVEKKVLRVSRIM